MKKLCGFLCAVALTGLLAGSALAADFTLKLANAGPADPEDRTVIAVEIFKNHVETKTGGSLKVEVFHASQLGNEKEILEGLALGT
ncbi:MAG: C4-dicarboxylate ABC transporter substrate-binding protein, partial [Synergistetes bacterium HGW-Synergistetes-2]